MLLLLGLSSALFTAGAVSAARSRRRESFGVQFTAEGIPYSQGGGAGFDKGGPNYSLNQRICYAYLDYIRAVRPNEWTDQEYDEARRVFQFPTGDMANECKILQDQAMREDSRRLGMSAHDIKLALKDAGPGASPQAASAVLARRKATTDERRAAKAERRELKQARKNR